MKAQPLKEFNPMHPGEFIKVTFCDPLNISISQLSEMLNQDIQKNEHLLHGKEDVTPELASLLSDVFGRSQKSWLIMQKHFNEYRNTTSNPSIFGQLRS
jgi:addiction module HigA family antidote